MKKLLLSLLCAFVALGMNAATVVDLYKDFTTTQNISWGSEAANARISFSDTDGLIYSSTEATANNWDAQYWVANGNTFAPENTYKLTMLVKGSVAGTIGNIKLGDWGQGVDNYDKFNIPTGEFQEVSINVSGVTGGDGILLQTGSYVGDLCIKWVKITHEDLSDASKLCLELTDIPAGSNAWDHQLQYPFDPAIPAGDYTLSLDVKGDAAGSMSIWGDYVEGANYGPSFTFGTTWETKNVDFTLAKDYKQFALVFGQYVGSSISFDNITITNKTTGDVVVSADFSSATLEGFKVAGFWTNDGGWVEHKANYQIVEASTDPEPEPWVCPDGETDITTLAWVKEGQDCDNKLGQMTDATVFGTDSGNGPISYVDLTDFASIKVYGPAGQRVRFFINRDEFPSNFQFYADINAEGVGVLDLASVWAAQEGATYIHLNGVKAAAWGEKLQLEGITVVEPSSVVVTIDEALTYSSNKILDFSEVTEAEAYIATACDGEKVTMTKVTGAVPAGTGLVIVGNGNVEIPFADASTENVSSNMLVATTVATNVPTGSYVLAGTGASLGWYSIGATPANLAAGKAYLAAGTGAKKNLQIVWGDDAVTAADAVEANTVENGAWYTISGVKVAAPTVSGLYIHNGKKVSVNK